MRKYRMLRERLMAQGGFELEPSPLAGRAVVERTHDLDYVEAFLNGTLSAAAVRRIGFPWSAESVRRTLASVGGTLAAARVALRYGLSGQLAGGTHHAFRAEGSGFCIFNDICVAIRQLRHEGLIERAAVVDLDVHQGDGTALLMQDDPLTLTFSAHGRHNFPFRKQRSTIDLEFDDGVADEEYLAAVADVVPRVQAFAPEIVFYQAGVDPLASDTLGKLALTHDGLRRRDEMVLRAFADRPLVITLGGGYADPIEATVEAHANTFLAARAAYDRRAFERG
jgi:acetoin utilization deacetylase AcuC-like enzyme